jgi:hypothetical protein
MGQVLSMWYSLLVGAVIMAGLERASAQQPPPLNTAIVVFATVAGNIQANDAYWKKKCKDVPADATFLMLDMGSVRDYFSPIDGASICQMLASRNKHHWSTNGVDWRTPAYNAGSSHNRGGSKVEWPANNVDGDERHALSMWGNEGSNMGGCCSQSLANWHSGWGQAFTLAYGVPLQPPPLNTGTTVVVTNDGTVRCLAFGVESLCSRHNGILDPCCLTPKIKVCL